MEKEAVAGKRHSYFNTYLRGAPKERLHISYIAKQGEIPRCKNCESRNVIKYGYYNGIQRWYCKECKRKFADNKAAPGMKTPIDQVSSVLSMYYEGMGLKAIIRHLQQMHHSYPSSSTIYEWIKRITKSAIAADKEYIPKVGDVWFADETVLKVGSQPVWVWDIIDVKTRFLLASHLSTKHTMYNIRVVMAKATRKARKQPKVVVSNHLAHYIDSIEFNLGTKNKHITAKDLRTTCGTQLIERLHSVFEARTEIMRGFNNLKTARTIMEGWTIHYNYLRPYEVLNNNAPAHKAGINKRLKIKTR